MAAPIFQKYLLHFNEAFIGFFKLINTNKIVPKIYVDQMPNV